MLESCNRGVWKAVEVIDGSDITGMRPFQGSAGLSTPDHRLADHDVWERAASGCDAFDR
jgi:hypothetical protein